MKAYKAHKNGNVLSIILIFSMLSFVVTPFYGVNAQQVERDNIKAAPQSIQMEDNYVENEVLVKFRQDDINLYTQRGQNKLNTFSESRNLAPKKLNKKQNTALLKSDDKPVQDLISDLSKDPSVEFAQPNYIYEPRAVPNDTEFNKLWGLHNTGQNVNGFSGTSDADIDWSEADDILNGKTIDDVIVAVIDSGVAYNHPDLQANMWNGSSCLDYEGSALGGCNYGYDFEDDDKTPLPTSSSHGTHIAGIIAGVTNNSLGITGVSSNTKIMALKSSLTTFEIGQAIAFAEFNGAKIINASWGTYGTGGEHYDVALYNAISNFTGLFIVAAGNEGFNHDDGVNAHKSYPDGFKITTPIGPGLANIIVVAATDQNDNLAPFSDFGVTSVDIGAPGKNIYSTVPYNGFLETFENAVTPGFTGTSFTSSGSNNYWETYGTTNITAWGNHYMYPYEANSNGILTSGTIDTSAQSSVILSYEYVIESEYHLSCSWDYLSLEVYNGSTWNEVNRYCGAFQYGVEVVDISSYINSNMQIRFKWFTDSTVSNYFGAFIDNIKIFYPNSTSGSYEYMQGTSMAAPFAVGEAAVLWGYKPSASIDEIKSILLDTGDSLSSLNGKTATGKRINLNNALKSFSYAELDNLPNNPTNVTSTNISIDGIDVAAYKYKLDTGSYGTETLSTNNIILSSLGNGNHTLSVIGKDSRGNWQLESEATTYTWKVDTVKPTATISYSTTKLTNGDVVATLAPSETVTITNNGGSNKYTFTSNGNFTFEFKDEAGNSGSAKATVGNIDKTRPSDPTGYWVYSDSTKTKPLTNPDTTYHSYNKPYFTWSGASDDESGIEGYYVKFSDDLSVDALDGTFIEKSSFTAPEITKDGSYFLKIKTVDKAGNISWGVWLTYLYVAPEPEPEPAPILAPEPQPTPAPPPTPTPTPEPEPIVLGEETGTPYIVTGTKSGGGPEVRVFTTSGDLVSSFNAYSDTFRGGINVAVGDMDGDGTMEIITSTRTGGVPTIRVFDMDGIHLGWDFDAYDEGFRGGINLGVGDIEGDGPYEIAVAPMSGGAPHVRIFGMRNGEIVPTTESFMAYAETFRGGIAISIGDIENDGIGDIITSPTSNGGPHIRIFGVRNRRYVPVTLGTMAYAENFRGGINSCVGDVNNDGKDEIMTGIVSAGGPHVRIFGVGSSRRFELSSPGFMAYDPSSRGGIEVTSIDINGDGYDEIITGVGGDGSPLVRIFNSEGVQISPEFMAYSGEYKSGITLATGYFE